MKTRSLITILALVLFAGISSNAMPVPAPDKQISAENGDIWSTKDGDKCMVFVSRGTGVDVEGECRFVDVLISQGNYDAAKTLLERGAKMNDDAKRGCIVSSDKKFLGLLTKYARGPLDGVEFSEPPTDYWEARGSNSLAQSFDIERANALFDFGVTQKQMEEIVYAMVLVPAKNVQEETEQITNTVIYVLNRYQEISNMDQILPLSIINGYEDLSEYLFDRSSNGIDIIRTDLESRFYECRKDPYNSRYNLGKKAMALLDFVEKHTSREEMVDFINAKDSDGNTFLHLVIKMFSVSFDIPRGQFIDKLLALGANKELLDNNGKRAIDYCLYTARDFKYTTMDVKYDCAENDYELYRKLGGIIPPPPTPSERGVWDKVQIWIRSIKNSEIFNP
jgi:ankyrin repeat protein